MVFGSNYFSIGISFLYFIQKNILVKPSWFFSTFFQIANILVVWCFAFFLANIILFFLIHNRSNRSRSVLIVRNFNGKEFPVTFFSGKYLKCPKLIRIQGTATFYFHSLKLLRKLYFAKIWSLSSNNFMYRDTNTNVGNCAE